MRIVASAEGIEIHAPDDAYFSFFNSPYIGHNLGAAVDVYPRHQEWDGPAFAPAAGRITKIRKLHMGNPKPFPTDDFDYGIALKPENSKSSIMRIMHAVPTVQEGNIVDLGDQIGRIIRSRYFNYWTGPHYHVEVMSSANFSRSSKSIPFDLRMDHEIHQIGVTPSNLEIIITEVSDDHAIGYPKEKIHTNIGDLSGLSVQNKSGSAIGIIDAGISHYQHGGVIGTNRTNVGEPVYVGKNQVGIITNIRGSAAHFKRGISIEASINGIELLGLSCFLYPPQYKRKGTPQLILIPKHYRGFRHILDGDTCSTLQIRCGTVSREYEENHKS